jgi:hypothetical protein
MTQSELASAITSTASTYQANASETRLGLPRPPNPSLQKAQSKAVAIRDERKKKAALNQIKESIRVAGSLWEIPYGWLGTQSKMTIVCVFMNSSGFCVAYSDN